MRSYSLHRPTVSYRVPSQIDIEFWMDSAEANSGISRKGQCGQGGRSSLSKTTLGRVDFAKPPH